MAPTAKLANSIDHVAFVLDRSSSIDTSGLTGDIITVVDNEVKSLAEESVRLDRETRVTIYAFADRVECLVFDKDVLRLPSIASMYKPYGSTAMIDGTMTALNDLSTTSQLYGEHSFLCYTMTDGIENCSRKFTPTDLQRKIALLPSNWTVACFVPDKLGKRRAVQYGFHEDNVGVWSTTGEGVREVGSIVRKATSAWSQARASGVRGTRSIFNLDPTRLDPKKVVRDLEKLHPGQYRMYKVEQSDPRAIAEFVEAKTGATYLKGHAHYQITKAEKVQDYKTVFVWDRDAKVMYGGPQARELLDLPDYEVSVHPSKHPKYDIFVQSTSVNRLLVPGTQVLLV